MYEIIYEETMQQLLSYLYTMKIKYTLILSTALSLSVSTFAQYSGADFPQAYGSFNAGYAMPIGSFGASTSADWTGYAKGGASYTIQVGIPVAHSNFGVAIMAGYNNNKFDAAAYGTNLAKADTGNSYSTVTVAAYTQYYLMTGLLVTSNTISGFSVDGHLEIGVDYINYPNPYWTTTSIRSRAQAQLFLTTSPTTTLAIAIGGAAHYAFDNGFTVLANINFMHTGASANTTLITDNKAGQTITYPTNSVSMSCLSISLGLGYSLGN